jgi:putative ubiquitin-RnfH superfamily antitoxin RatB of RatAB toxin-antitoxin module
MDDNAMEVEIAYAKPDEQVILSLSARADITLRDAIEQSGILRQFPEIDLALNKVGVFGKVARLDARLSAGDRVEIYRPLIADPKEQRKKRAAEGKELKKRG